MKLDKDQFLMNMNMVKLDGKKVLVQPSQVELIKGKEVIIGEERPPGMIKPKSLKDVQWQKNEGSKPQQRSEATFDILIAKYKEGRADIRGHENWTIRNTKLDSLVSLSQASTSIAGSPSGKRSCTPPCQNSEGQDHHQQDYHLTAYLPVGPPMLGPWGPPSMMYPPCPPWAGWYGPWAPLLMHFHLGWSGPMEGFGHKGDYAGNGRYGYINHQQDMRASRQENQTVQNTKLDHPISLKIAATPGHWQEQEAPKDGSSTNQPGSSQGRTGLGSESLANGEAKLDAEKSLEEVVAEQDKVLKAKAETRIEAEGGS
jgi:hypothetical protein